MRSNPPKRIYVCVTTTIFHSPAETIQIQMSTKPIRNGERWTKAEEAEILASIKTGLTIQTIADRKQRTPGGIRSRLTRIACSLVLSNVLLSEASTRTSIGVVHILSALERKMDCKAAQIQAPQPPKMEFKFDTTFSRQKLQGHAEETRKAEEAAAEARMRDTVKAVVAHTIAPQVLEAARTKATFYLWEGSPQVHGVKSDDILRGLREKFPECTVTLAEEWVDVIGRGNLRGIQTRILKSGIKIDWS